MSIPVNIQETLNDQAREFALYLYKKLHKELKKNKNRNSDDLLNSLKVTYSKTTASNLPVFKVEYAKHGKFIDTKKLYWRDLPPVEELINWIKTKGQSRFKHVPGYINASPTNRFKAVERIAWAIVKKKHFDFKHRQKKWKKDNLNIAISYLNHIVAEQFAQFAAEAVVKPLND